VSEERDEAAVAAGAENKQPARRGPGRRFQPGQSGNPKGATPGRRHPALEALDKIGLDNAQGVLSRVIQDALAGDVRASEIILRRVWPERKGKPVRLTLPDVNCAADLVLATARVTDAMACGDISPEEAQSISAVLEVHRRTIETRDLEARLRRIEEVEGKV